VLVGVTSLLAAQQLHRHERHRSERADIIDGDDVVVLDPGHRPGLGQEAHAGLGPAAVLGLHHLEGELAV
jgi:hypothetical protein